MRRFANLPKAIEEEQLEAINEDGTLDEEMIKKQRKEGLFYVVSSPKKKRRKTPAQWLKRGVWSSMQRVSKYFTKVNKWITVCSKKRSDT